MLIVDPLTGAMFRLDENLTVVANLKIFKYKVGDVIPVELDTLGYGNAYYSSKLYSSIPKLFKIVSMNIREDLSVEVGLQEHIFDPYDVTKGLTTTFADATETYTTSKTPVGTPVINPNSPDNHVGDFFAEYDKGIGATRNYMYLGWEGPTGDATLEFGFNLIDVYQIRYTSVGDNLTNPSGVLQDAAVTVDINASGVITSVTGGGSPNQGYGYWVDSSFEVDTNWNSPGNKAEIAYEVDGYGGIASFSIVNGGTNYTTGSGVDISSYLPTKNIMCS